MPWGARLPHLIVCLQRMAWATRWQRLQRSSRSSNALLPPSSRGMRWWTSSQLDAQAAVAAAYAEQRRMPPDLVNVAA
jgi:hypothetical protein